MTLTGIVINCYITIDELVLILRKQPTITIFISSVIEYSYQMDLLIYFNSDLRSDWKRCIIFQEGDLNSLVDREK